MEGVQFATIQDNYITATHLQWKQAWPQDCVGVI
jgi:hypothetical protein